PKIEINELVFRGPQGIFLPVWIMPLDLMVSDDGPPLGRDPLNGPVPQLDPVIGMGFGPPIRPLTIDTEPHQHRFHRVPFILRGLPPSIVDMAGITRPAVECGAQPVKWAAWGRGLAPLDDKITVIDDEILYLTGRQIGHWS